MDTTPRAGLKKTDSWLAPQIAMSKKNLGFTPYHHQLSHIWAINPYTTACEFTWIPASPTRWQDDVEATDEDMPQMQPQQLHDGGLLRATGSPPAPVATAHDTGPPGVTQLLADAGNGDHSAWHRIYELLYKDLHRIARAQIRSRAALQVSPTSLISEAWLKLAGAKLAIEDRRHLTALIARAMRFVLLDETRRILADKRRAAEGTVQTQDDPVDADAARRLEQLLVLGQALDDLSRMDERLAEVVELRYFGGLTEEEIAGHLNLHVRTIRRDWRRARAFLLGRLGGDGSEIAI